MEWSDPLTHHQKNEEDGQAAMMLFLSSTLAGQVLDLCIFMLLDGRLLGGGSGCNIRGDINTTPVSLAGAHSG